MRIRTFVLLLVLALSLLEAGCQCGSCGKPASSPASSDAGPSCAAGTCPHPWHSK